MGELKERFLSVYNNAVHRDGSDMLLRWLEDSDFFVAPASTKFHGCHEGGLLQHSLNVYDCLKRGLANAGLQNSYPEETVAVVSLLHDICKVNFYKKGFRNVKDKRLTSGNYSEEEEQRILAAKEWLKTRKFTHIYIPMFDQQSIYTAVNKVKHTQGLDVLIVDYFKGKGEGDAFDSYQELGRFVDMVKNQICGEMNIAGIGAAQATITGKLADSAKIARNASTIAMISDKTPEEIEADGAECGNKKLRVTVNRNGMQMTQDEYIDLLFDGNHILYEQAKQHIPQTPF